MVNSIPESWSYNKELEMLFLFYQETDELLSQTTVDTYALPLHNTVTLVNEIYETYLLLKINNVIDSYYSKYIPAMIDELLFQIQSDYLFKKIIGDRLQSICTGFGEAKNNHVLLKRWLDYTRHSCSLKKYLDFYKNEIINLITNTKSKEKLLYCSKNYYISLLNAGYTREYIYKEAKHYFNNKNIAINNSVQIKDYLNIFNCKYNNYEFFVLMNVADIEYLENINENIKIDQNIKAINVDEEKKILKSDYVASDLFKQYDRMKCEEKKHEKIKIVRFFSRSLDPYMAICEFNENIKYLQTFTMYFKHYFYSKRIFKILIKKDDGFYHEIHEPNKYQKRPFVEQATIDKRVENIITGKSLGIEAKRSLSRAIEMHAESFDSRNTVALFRSLWTAFETIFIDSNPNSIHSNIVNSALAIIQKTYILKLMRTLYAQLTQSISKSNLKTLAIEDFESFVLYFAKNEENSEEMKSLYAFLEYNPLLRSRLHYLRKTLSTGDRIKEYLDAHKTKIEWQLKRLCVIRNIATHLGEELRGADIAINHLHNYFDYIVNFVLCKAENGDYVSSISATVFEAQNDLQIHREALKTPEKLCENNYYKFLFGPDKNIIKYNFE